MSIVHQCRCSRSVAAPGARRRMCAAAGDGDQRPGAARSLGNDQVQIAIGGQSIDVVSQVPLQAGQTLQLAVSQTADGNSGSRWSEQGPPAGGIGAETVTPAPDLRSPAATNTRRDHRAGRHGQLTPPQTGRRRRGAQTAAAQQTSLAPLFANLGAAAAGRRPAAAGAAGGAASAGAADQARSRSDGDDIKQAFQNSGLFLESVIGAGIGSAGDRIARPQGGADRAAPGADDIARARAEAAAQGPRRRARRHRRRTRRRAASAAIAIVPAAAPLAQLSCRSRVAR